MNYFVRVGARPEGRLEDIGVGPTLIGPTLNATESCLRL